MSDISTLDSLLIVASVKNELANKLILKPEENLLGDILKFLGYFASAFFGFILAKVSQAWAKYNYLNNLRSYVDVWAKSFFKSLNDIIQDLETYQTHLVSIVNNTEFNKEYINCEPIELDIERILSINQTDSYLMFVDLRLNSDKNRMHSAYNSMLIDFKLIVQSLEKIEQLVLKVEKLESIRHRMKSILWKLVIEVRRTNTFIDIIASNSELKNHVTALTKIIDDYFTDEANSAFHIECKEKMIKAIIDVWNAQYIHIRFLPNHMTILELTSSLSIEVEAERNLLNVVTESQFNLASYIKLAAPRIAENYRILNDSQKKSFWNVIFHL